VGGPAPDAHLRRSNVHFRARGRGRAHHLGDHVRLLHHVLVLHPPRGAGRDQYRQSRQSAVPLDRHVPDDAGDRPPLLLAGVAALPSRLRAVRQPIPDRQPRGVLRCAGAAAGGRPALDRSGVLCVGEHVRAVRRHGVLGLHGRPLPERAGETPVRLHRGGKLARRNRRLGSNGFVGADRPALHSLVGRVHPARDRVPVRRRPAPPVRWG
jgi:hypothetical protein